MTLFILHFSETKVLYFIKVILRFNSKYLCMEYVPFIILLGFSLALSVRMRIDVTFKYMQAPLHVRFTLAGFHLFVTRTTITTLYLGEWWLKHENSASFSHKNLFPAHVLFSTGKAKIDCSFTYHHLFWKFGFHSLYRFHCARLYWQISYRGENMKTKAKQVFEWGA